MGKFDEKFTNCAQATSFIPSDLINYLKKSEIGDDVIVKLPTPLIYGLKIKKRSVNCGNHGLPDTIVKSRRVERVGRLREIVRRNNIRCGQYSSIGPDVIDVVSVVNKAASRGCWDTVDVDVLRPRTMEQFLNDNMEMIDK